MLRTPTCPTCLENYSFQDRQPIGPKVPLNLTCSHTFCEECLLKKITSGNEIECPICKTKTVLSVEGNAGVRELMPNVYLLGYLALNRRLSGISTHAGSPTAKFKGIPLARQHLQETEHTEGEEPDAHDDQNDELCEQCLKEVATCQCKSCDYCKFCADCFRQVHKSAKLSKHQQLPLDMPVEQLEECSVHIGRTLEFFDKDLNELICALCLISEKCKGHDIVRTDEMKFPSSADLDADIAMAKEQLAILDYSKKVIQRSMPEVTMEANQIIQDIQAHFMALHSLLQKRELHVLDMALQKATEDSSLDEMYQEVSETHKQLYIAVKEGEKLCKEKQVLDKRQNEVKQKLETLKDTPCYAERINEAENVRVSFQIEQSHVDMFDEIGSVIVKSSRKIDLKKFAELSEEDIAAAKSELVTEPPLSFVNLKLLDHVPTETIDPSVFTVPESKIIHAMRASYERVYVTDIRSPTDFSIQRVSDKERLQSMMRAVNNFCRQSDSSMDLVMSARKGDLVLSQFTKDNNWYRAIVINERPSNAQGLTPTWENGIKIQVHYVDYGNKEWVPLARLRRMKQEFLDVPELAVSCSLCDIVPPHKQEKWPKTSIDAFASLVGEGVLMMNIRYRHEGRLFVDLKKPDDDEPTPDDDRPLSTRDAMVFLEVACFRSKYSVPKKEICRPSRIYKEMQCPAPGEMLDVVVSSVNSPLSIFVQKLENATAIIEKDLRKLYSGRGKEAGRILYPYRNLVCAARFSEDKKWYRALVKAVNEDKTVSVVYVDFGNSEIVKFSDIRKLPDTWLSIPKQALEVQLADIGMLEGETEWSEKVINFLTQKVSNKPTVMIVEECQDDELPSVRLCDTSTDRDIYIAPLLVHEGLVTSTGPSSDPKSIEMVLKELTSSPKKDSSLKKVGEEIPDLPPSVDEPAPTTQASQCYSQTELKPDEKLDLVGVYVNDNGRIFAHLRSDSRVLATVMDALNPMDGHELEGLSTPTTSGVLHKNLPCLAKYSLDDNWYRAIIEAVVDQETVKVDFVDFGNEESVSLDNIRLPGLYLEVPKQAVAVDIADVVPATSNGNWSPEGVNFIREMVENQEFTATVTGETSDLKLKKTRWASVTLADGVDLSKLLIKEGFAVSALSVRPKVSPEKFKNDEVRYGTSVLPSPGTEFDVMVTQVEKENLIVMQRLPHTEYQVNLARGDDETRMEATFQASQLAEFSAKMNEPGFFTEESKVKLEDLATGMACCVQDKNDGTWYRAKIKQLSKSGKERTVTVLYVDYGLSDVVDVESIRKIPRSIAQLPCQGIFGRISGLCLVPTSNPEEKRKTMIAAMKDLYNVVANKRLVAVILESGPISTIALLERIPQSDAETGELIDVHIGETMAKQGHVTFDPPSYEAIHVAESKEDSDKEEMDERSPTSTSPTSTKMMELPKNSDPNQGP